MPHLRKRYLSLEVQRQAKFWPVVGILGLRQSGKSTVFRELLGLPNYATLDDENNFEDVSLSAKNFLAKLGEPAVIDEAQKAPALFDAIKMKVDLKRRPGRYFLTGSSQFSAKLGIRESLTGRIGLTYLYPFTLGEAHEHPLEPRILCPDSIHTPRFASELSIERLAIGGLPVPLFTRSPEERARYFQGWLETAVIRDASRVYGKGYNPDLAWSVLRQIGQALKEGELPTLSHFKQNSRVLRKYLDALSDIFLLRKIPCHETGVGKEVWMVTDGGIATSMMGSDRGEGATLSLSRIFLWNELLASNEAAGERLRPLYYKSARGAPVDLIWKNTLIKVSVLPKSQSEYDWRPLRAALKVLGLKKGRLVVPRDQIEWDKKALGVVPLTYWS